MQFYYGDKMPLRILDEGEFWKLQEAEHTEVIQALVPNLEPQFVQALKAWEQALSRTQATFVQYIETVVRGGKELNQQFYTQVMQLVQFAAEQSKQFIKLLNQLGTESQALKQNATAVVVLNHIRRESEYFIGISNALLYQQ
ncbi:DUF2935 domain-containing protein [Paenibacillus psychroresistens]|uniref:DUF2935 domain-containing protein n=1 Tax=Paenibacillus psychroresistens TaxID=1778678 RepID=A0A6B8RKS5_9BACL|nr:DUF2935 domain-containing protein [Paenibacillus psychroresistens]QGQ96153.1 DUF2935 domain-containing protein [Paenibacillus psychroresistens]